MDNSFAKFVRKGGEIRAIEYVQLAYHLHIVVTPPSHRHHIIGPLDKSHYRLNGSGRQEKGKEGRIIRARAEPEKVQQYKRRVS
jgi:hypothetical protein